MYRPFLLLIFSASLFAGRILAQTDATPPKQIDASAFPTLQAALDALPASGGIVTIPPGNYELTEALEVKTAETRIEGSGASTHIINKSESGSHALLIRPPDLAKNKKAALWRVQVGNLRISGNPKSGDGIYANHIQEIFLQGVSLDHNGGNGIHLDSCYENPRVNDSMITYNGLAGLQITASHDIVVNGNHFEENQDAIRCIDSFNLCCNGNNIDDHLRHGIVIENTYGSVCSGNMIEECNGTAIILDRDAYGITLSANVIAHHLGGGIDLRDANGCAVSANTFVLCHGFSVRVGKESGRDSINGNAFANSNIGGGQLKRKIREHKDAMQIDTGSGIVIEGASDLAITGNTFTGLDTAAVKATGDAAKMLVSSNVLTECGRKLPKGAKWIDLGEAKQSIVKDNLGAD